MNEHAEIFETTICCGVRFLYHIAGLNTEDIVYTVALRHREGGRNDGTLGAHYVFTDNTGRDGDYGDRLMDFVNNHDLGVVTRTEYNENPNSGNMLRLYSWTPNRDGLLAWLDEVMEAQVADALEGNDLEIGSFVRCGENTPNRFRGRGRITGVRGGYLEISLKDGGNHRMLLGEADTLVQTRPYPVN